MPQINTVAACNYHSLKPARFLGAKVMPRQSDRSRLGNVLVFWLAMLFGVPSFSVWGQTTKAGEEPASSSRELTSEERQMLKQIQQAVDQSLKSPNLSAKQKEQIQERHLRWLEDREKQTRERNLVPQLGNADEQPPRLPTAGPYRVKEDQQKQEIYELVGKVQLKGIQAAFRDASELRRESDKVIQTARERLGKDHSFTAWSLNQLGLGLWKQGDYATARSYFEEALRIRAKPSSKGDLEVPAAARVHRAFGDPNFGANAELAESLRNLGCLAREMKDYVAARSYLEQAVIAEKQMFGEVPSQQRTGTLNNLASLLCEKGDYLTALPYLQEAADWESRTNSQQHGQAGSAFSLMALGNGLRQLGEYPAAHARYEEALAVCEMSNPRLKVDCLNNLAIIEFLMDDAVTAVTRLKEGLHQARENLEMMSDPDSERQQLIQFRAMRSIFDAYLSLAATAGLSTGEVYREVLTWKGTTFARQSRRLQSWTRPGQPELKTELDRVTRELHLLVSTSVSLKDREDPEGYSRKVSQLTAEFSRLKLEIARPPSPEEIREALPDGATLIDFFEYERFSRPKSDKGELERERQLVAFVVRRDRPIEQVHLGPIAPIARLVDRWRELNLFEPVAEERGIGGQARRQGVPSSDVSDPAVELHRHVWKPLEQFIGDADVILISPDGPLGRFPFAVLPGKSPGAYLIEEHALAMVPAPQLLPAMLARETKTSTEGAAFTRLKTRSAEAVVNLKPSFLLVGDVDFNASPGSAKTKTSGAIADPLVTGGATPLPVHRSKEAVRGGKLEFNRLPGAVEEVKVLSGLWKTSYADGSLQLLRGGEATEQVFRQSCQGRRFIHVATHGFFAPAQVRSAFVTGVHSSDCRYRELAQEHFLRIPDDPSVWQYNFANSSFKLGMKGPNRSEEREGRSICCWHPGLLSGIVLAGANQTSGLEIVAQSAAEPAPRLGEGIDKNPTGRDDGILTAIEVADLDLRGTELVALSACETGLGEAAGGEGLWGLQRAFQASGARTVVASLWKVDDQASQQLMSRFYTNLWSKGMGKLAALHEAQLSLLYRQSPTEQRTARGPGGVMAANEGRDSAHAITKRAPPRLWAAWVLSGDPGDLSQITTSPQLASTSATAADESKLPASSAADITGPANNPQPAARLRNILTLSVAGSVLLLVSFWYVHRRLTR